MSNIDDSYSQYDPYDVCSRSSFAKFVFHDSARGLCCYATQRSTGGCRTDPSGEHGVQDREFDSAAEGMIGDVGPNWPFVTTQAGVSQGDCGFRPRLQPRRTPKPRARATADDIFSGEVIGDDLLPS